MSKALKGELNRMQGWMGEVSREMEILRTEIMNALDENQCTNNGDGLRWAYETSPNCSFSTIFCQQANKQTEGRLEKFLIQNLG